MNIKEIVWVIENKKGRITRRKKVNKYRTKDKMIEDAQNGNSTDASQKS